SISWSSETACGTPQSRSRCCRDFGRPRSRRTSFGACAKAGSTSSSARTASSRRTSISRTGGYACSTRSTAAASAPSRVSSSCGADLAEVEKRLGGLVREVRIGVGHGQMDARALDKVMLGFVGGETDVLLSTAIIESGLDIPRANTMIINRADTFGLAQLYQLRGRVGRSRERAYAYLLVPPPSTMRAEATSRIEALEKLA